MARKFCVAALDFASDRSGFRSGVDPLDRYFRAQVSQDIKRRVTACFVATNAHGQIAAYYTLASASVLLADLPEALAEKLPRYPSVPAVRMGRLAVDQAFKGQGLGAALLADALRRAVTAEIAAYALASAYQHKSNEGTDEGTAQSVALEPAPALDIWRRERDSNPR